MRLSRSMAGLANAKRLAALVSLLAVFFLPLHFHSLTVTTKLAKECACLQGSRTQLAPSAPPAYVPIISVQPVVVQTNSSRSFECIKLQFARGPPAPLSV